MLVAPHVLEARSVASPKQFVAFLKRLSKQFVTFLTNPSPAFRMRLLVAIGAYSVSAIFGLAFLLTRVVAPQTKPLLALSVAIGAAAPLALALLWGRLAALKIGPVQLDLTQITVPLVSIDLAEAVPQLSVDAVPDLAEKVLELIATPDTKLVEVNLHAQPYWWPSRLFFLAVLLDDYTDIRRVVFVTGDARKDYVGMARPHVIRRDIAAARATERYEDVYRKAEELATATNSLPDSDLHQRLRAIATSWWSAYTAVHTPPGPNAKPVYESQPSPEQLVTAQELRRLLGDKLSATSVEWDDRPGTTLDYYQFLFCAEEFVALTRQAQPETGQRRLEGVVSVSRMATEISRQVLRRQLEGGR